ncbi:hypothetical protein D3C72_2241770 [compost metagenome]
MGQWKFFKAFRIHDRGSGEQASLYLDARLLRREDGLAKDLDKRADWQDPSRGIPPPDKRQS